MSDKTVQVLVVVYNAFEGTSDLYLAPVAESLVPRLRDQEEMSPAMAWALCPKETPDQKPPADCTAENCGDVFGLLVPYKLNDTFTGPIEAVQEVIKTGLY